MDTSGYKDVVPGRQKLIPRTNKRRQQPVIGITPIPFLCQLIYLSNNNKRNGHTKAPNRNTKHKILKRQNAKTPNIF